MKRQVIIFLAGIGFATATLAQQGVPEPSNSSSTQLISTAESESSAEEAATSLLLQYDLIRTSGFSNGKKRLDQSSRDSMSRIAMHIKHLSPLSFSAHYVSFKEEGYTQKGLEALKKAEAATANKAELYSDFISVTHILKNNTEFRKYCSKLRNSGFIPNEVLEYNRNVLRSIPEQKAFIVTNGWDDTFPLLSLLEEEKKKNIRVIQTEWLFDENYRTQIAQELNASPTPYANDPYQWISAVSKTTNNPVYFTPSLPGAELMKLSNELSPTGILFKRGVLTQETQVENCLVAWKKFAKSYVDSSHPISKNYIILLTLLETNLASNPNEAGTLAQIRSFKKQIELRHPTLK